MAMSDFLILYFFIYKGLPSFPVFVPASLYDVPSQSGDVHRKKRGLPKPFSTLMSKIKGAIVDFKKYPTLRTKRYWYFLTMTDISEHLK